VLADPTWAHRDCSVGSWLEEGFVGKSIVLAVADAAVAVADNPVELDFVNRSVEVAA